MGARNQLLILYNFCVVHGDPTLMALFGSRVTLVANVCALLLAPTMIYVGSYIVQQCRGYDWLLQDAPLYLFPAIAMMVVRREIFSHCFLLLYVWEFIQMLLQARSIQLGIHACGDRLGDPVQYVLILFVV